MPFAAAPFLQNLSCKKPMTLAKRVLADCGCQHSEAVHLPERVHHRVSQAEEGARGCQLNSSGLHTDSDRIISARYDCPTCIAIVHANAGHHTAMPWPQHLCCCCCCFSCFSSCSSVGLVSPCKVAFSCAILLSECASVSCAMGSQSVTLLVCLSVPFVNKAALCCTSLTELC